MGVGIPGAGLGGAATQLFFNKNFNQNMLKMSNFAWKSCKIA